MKTNKKDIIINNSNIDFFKIFLPLDNSNNSNDENDNHDNDDNDQFEELIIKYNSKSYLLMIDKMFNYADGFWKLFINILVQMVN